MFRVKAVIYNLPDHHLNPAHLLSGPGVSCRALVTGQMETHEERIVQSSLLPNSVRNKYCDVYFIHTSGQIPGSALYRNHLHYSGSLEAEMFDKINRMCITDCLGLYFLM